MTLPFNLQLIDEKEDYQTDYPYWRIMNMHWLMGPKFFFIPSTIKTKYMAPFVVMVYSRWLFCIHEKFPNFMVQYYDSAWAMYKI